MKKRFLFLCLLLLPSISWAATISVVDLDDGSTPSCENKAGHLDVQAAVDDAESGDIVSVPAGSWTGRAWTNRIFFTVGP